MTTRHPDSCPTVPAPAPASPSKEKRIANALRLVAWDLERGEISVQDAFQQIAAMAERLA